MKTYNNIKFSSSMCFIGATATRNAIGSGHNIIRIALHPRDPAEAIKDQKQIISILKDSAYEMPTYKELIPKLEELAPSTRLD
jgi:hypothetical protein